MRVRGTECKHSLRSACLHFLLFFKEDEALKTLLGEGVKEVMSMVMVVVITR